MWALILWAALADFIIDRDASVAVQMALVFALGIWLAKQAGFDLMMM